jgi:hypothetical protein
VFTARALMRNGAILRARNDESFAERSAAVIGAARRRRRGRILARHEQEESKGEWDDRSQL